MKCPYKIKYQVRVPRIMADGNPDLKVTEWYYESANYDRAFRKAMEAFNARKASMIVLILTGPRNLISTDISDVEIFRTHILEMTLMQGA